jgi:phasin family protein
MTTAATSIRWSPTLTFRLKLGAASRTGIAPHVFETRREAQNQLSNTVEDANRIAWSGARDVNVRFMTFIDENARAGFEHAERLAKAKEASEMMSIQQEYFKQQSQRLSEQMRELNEMSRKAGGEQGRPLSQKREWHFSG